ncbi:Calx-beta domain-containing protein, partial [Sulfitobacter sp.]|uniref:Calx-beta domain-containing protein n=1 Tax=Sulfitobacter sp. TaxID=1903071 RepID=UPI0030011AC5
MAIPSISFKSFGNFKPGEKSSLLSLVNLSDPDGGADIDAIWFRDESSGGGYIEVAGRVIPSGYTAGFHRDANVTVGSQEIKFTLRDLADAYFVSGPVGSSDRLVANASDGTSSAGAVSATLQVGGFASNPPRISIADATATEGGTLAYRVTLDRAADKDFTLSYYTTTGSASSAAGDYLGTTGSSITIREGATSAVINVRTTDDSAVEGTETTGLKLSGTSYGTIIDSTASGTIYDNDTASNPPRISIADATATEGGTLAYRVTLDRAADKDFTLSYYTTTGSASSAAGDYLGTTGSSITIREGATSAVINVRTTDDSAVEGTETTGLKLSGTSYGTIIDSTASGTIYDNDTASNPPRISIADATATEGGTLRFKITLDKVASEDISILYQTLVGSASQAGGDYFGTAGSTLVIPKGSNSAEVRIQTREDGVADATDTMSLKIVSVSGAQIADGTGKGFIFDNGKNIPTVADSADIVIPYPFDTDVHSVWITQYPNGTYSHNGDFASGWDFGLRRYSEVLAVADGVVIDMRESVPHDTAGSSNMGNFITIQFNAGKANEFYATYLHLEKDSIPVAIGAMVTKGDVVGEIGLTGLTTGYHLHFQTSKVLQTYGSGSAENTIKFAKGTSEYADLIEFNATQKIYNLPQPKITVSDAQAAEGDDLVFQVTLDQETDRDIQIEYRTWGASATHARGDYDGTTSATATIVKGTKTGEIRIATSLDAENEVTEFMKLQVLGVNYGELVRSAAEGEIQNTLVSQKLPNLSVRDASAVEGEVLQFELRLDQPTSSDVEVSYQLANGASSAVQAQYHQGSTVIKAGSSNGTIDIPTFFNSVSIADEQVRLSVKSANGAEFDPNRVVNGTVRDSSDQKALLIAQVLEAQSRLEEEGKRALGILEDTFSVADGRRFNFGLDDSYASPSDGTVKLTEKKVKLAGNLSVLNFEAKDIKEIQKKLWFLNAAIESLDVINAKSSDEAADEFQDLVTGTVAGYGVTATAGVAVAVGAGLILGTAALPLIAVGIVIGGVASYFYADAVQGELDKVWDNHFDTKIKQGFSAAAEVKNGVFEWTADKFQAAQQKVFDLFPNLKMSSLDGAASDDSNVLAGVQSSEKISALGGDDWIIHSDGNDSVDGGLGADTIDYSGADGRLIADLSSTTGSAMLVINTREAVGGGEPSGVIADVERVAFTDELVSIENVIATRWNDVIRGDENDNVIRAEAGNDFSAGGRGDDELYGGAGDDVLLGGAGADLLNGGSGVDRAQYSDALSGVVADLQVSRFNQGDAAGDAYQLIENLYGTSFADDLRGDGSNNTLWGAAGGDVLYGRAGKDVLSGMGDNDILYGQGHDDDLRGGAGDDVLLGGAGADSLNGGSGVDRAQYSDALARVVADLQVSRFNQGDAAGD